MLLALLFACVTQEPSYVSEGDLTKAAATGDTPTLCAGLRMKEEKTREAAASKLKDYGLSADCLCERLEYDGRWDPSILMGLAGGTDTEKLACVGALLDNTAQGERVALTSALLKIPATRARVVQAAGADPDAAVRAAAMPVFRNSKDAAELTQVQGWLGNDDNPTVRAAAATALFGQESAAAALSTAATKDADPGVRSAAIASLTSVKPADFDAVVCGALLADDAPEVRVAALGAMRATRDPEQLACLGERLAKEEASPEVRAALLKTLQSTSAPEAAKALCDGIPGWVKMYVKDAAPSEGDDILKAQNNRDFENSYACAQAAARQAGGYTCAGREYVGAFFRDVGGKGGPSCRGAVKKAASNEIEF